MNEELPYKTKSAIEAINSMIASYEGEIAKLKNLGTNGLKLQDYNPYNYYNSKDFSYIENHYGSPCVKKSLGTF